jgi:outer membrane protein assembly factor BamB
VLILTNQGLTFLDPADGSVRGNHEWEFEGYRVVQPLQVDGNGFLLGTTMGTGTRRIDVQLQGGQFSAQERWTSRGMSPAFNDYVAHQGYLYGFDNTIFACIDLETGQRQWKKGRYGNGQVLLLPDADQLLVSSESGEIVLLHATPERLDERARFQALDGKTWNHPVLIGKRLYIRNGEQAACFELP